MASPATKERLRLVAFESWSSWSLSLGSRRKVSTEDPAMESLLCTYYIICIRLYSLRQFLDRRPEPHRHQLRNPRLLHGHAVQHRRDAHGFLAVSDEHELRLDAHLPNKFGEAANVGFVKRGVNFVEDAERAGRVLEDPDQQREGGEC